MTTDNIDHPSHYNRGGIEAIDVIDAWGLGFDLGNVIKYVCRAGYKTADPREDLEKAAGYLAHALDKLPAATHPVAEHVSITMFGPPIIADLSCSGVVMQTPAERAAVAEDGVTGVVLMDGDGDWICPLCDSRIRNDASVQKMLDGRWAHGDCSLEERLEATAREMSEALGALCAACLVQGRNVVRAQCLSHSNLEREEAQRALDAVAADPIPF